MKEKYIPNTTELFHTMAQSTDFCKLLFDCGSTGTAYCDKKNCHMSYSNFLNKAGKDAICPMCGREHKVEQMKDMLYQAVDADADCPLYFAKFETMDEYESALKSIKCLK